MTLLALYAGSLVLGGILIGASMFGAGKEVEADGSPGLDHDHELAHDHDHGHEHEHHAHVPMNALAATLLSMRFWTFAVAAFGMTGLLLTFFGVEPLLGGVLATATGVGVGAAVSTMLRAVSRETVSSALDARALRGRDAEVVLAVGPDKIGKIRLTHNGQLIELPATTRESRLLERAERVLVVDVTGGTADVTPVEPDHRASHPLPTTS